jgi:hypothetical protein
MSTVIHTIHYLTLSHPLISAADELRRCLMPMQAGGDGL